MSDTIGARLRQARELHKLTLQQASETTKVRIHYLQALESDDFSAIPSAAQARGFLRIYSEFLGLELSELLTGLQPVPVPVSTEASGAAAVPPPRPGLLAGLRERLKPNPRTEVEPASSRSPAEPSAGVPASANLQTTRPAKPASTDIKKNGLAATEEPMRDAAAGESVVAASAEQSPSIPASDALPEEASVEGPTNPPASRVSVAWWLFRLRSRIPKPAASQPSEHPAASKPADAEDVPRDDSRPAAADLDPVVPPESARGESSTAIFLDIGQQLRTRRDMLNLTYEEIERHTHVRAPFLSALEQGCMEDLPSPVQTRGILLNYAKFLDLDVDAILLRFADGIQAQYREKGPRTPVRSRTPVVVKKTLPPLRGFVVSDLLFGGGLAITLLLFAVWGINRVMIVRSQQPAQVTAPSISDVLVSTDMPTLVQQVTVIPAEDTPVAAAVPLDTTATLELATLDPNVKVQVVLTATQSAYMRITVDGKVQFEGRAEAGSTYTYEASSQVEVLTGNAAGLKVSYNGQDLGLMGNFGEVADRLYTAEGVATPTSTPQPTRTPTPKVTATPTETLTRTPSPTPTR
jgi:cytoskeletal protein RodZ